MNQSELEEFVANMENVEREDNFGYIFYFVGDDHRLPFVTIGHSDNDFDKVSNLNRDGIFRINIGVSKETYQSLIAVSDLEDIDFSILDTFLPHPHYAKQNFLCILNPSGENVEMTQQLITEAYSIASSRFHRKTND